MTVTALQPAVLAAHPRQHCVALSMWYGMLPVYGHCQFAILFAQVMLAPWPSDSDAAIRADGALGVATVDACHLIGFVLLTQQLHAEAFLPHLLIDVAHCGGACCLVAPFAQVWHLQSDASELVQHLQDGEVTSVDPLAAAVAVVFVCVWPGWRHSLSCALPDETTSSVQVQHQHQRKATRMK